MNVVLNTEEANTVMSLVTAQLIDQGGLTEAGKKAIRDWRRDLTPGMIPLDAFTLRLNVAIGNFIADALHGDAMNEPGGHPPEQVRSSALAYLVQLRA